MSMNPEEFTMSMFEPFPKLTRFGHGWLITEKVDGSNAQVIIQVDDDTLFEPEPGYLARVAGHVVYAGSRSRLITPGKDTDNYGFAQFVHDNAEDFIEKLGPGRHYGEWAGLGIQRRYGMDQKVFALFNARRFAGAPLPDRVTTVPILAEGYFDNPGLRIEEAMRDLKENGSRFAPGFMDPEGIVMLHGPSRTQFKKTFDYDEAGKWAEKTQA